VRTNTLKAKLQAGETVPGGFVNFPSPQFVEVTGPVGPDFVAVHAEHRPLGEHGVHTTCLAVDSVGVAPIVRAPRSAPGVIPRYFDAGPLGLRVPTQGCA